MLISSLRFSWNVWSNQFYLISAAAALIENRTQHRMRF